MGFRTFYEQTGGAQEILGSEGQPVNKGVVEVFGRHNPPHDGHLKTLDKANDIAQNEGADMSLYTSRSQDPKKNPLPFREKLGFLKELAPQYADNWDDDEGIRTVLGAAAKAGQKGYKDFHFVGGSDRVGAMGDLLRRYNGNLYDFENIYSHSAGERDEEDEGVGGLSASKLRKFAEGGDFEGFSGGIGGGQKMELARRMFEAVRKYGQKNEDWEVAPRYNKEFIREMYLDGQLYEIGDIVESLSTGLIGKVHRCGTNHLICVTEEGIMFKDFVHDVQFV